MYWSPTSNGATFTGSGQWSLSITGDSVYLRVADGEALNVHLLNLVVMSRDVVESVEGYAANRRVVSVVVVEVEPAGQRQASFGL